MRWQLRLVALAILGAPLAAPPADAALEWATWVANGASLADGSFSDGQTAIFSGNVVGIATSASNGTASPAIPGEASGGNPPGVAAVTALPYPTGILDPGAFIMGMNLLDLAATDQAVFALSDMMCCRSYRLELLDGASSGLPLGGVVVTNYNLTFAGPIVADFDVTLNATTGALRVYNVHDAGGSYNHTGFTTFSNLPPETRAIRVTSDSLGTQSTEGVHFYLATEVPEPGESLSALAAAATFGLQLRAWRRRAIRYPDRSEGERCASFPSRSRLHP